MTIPTSAALGAVLTVLQGDSSPHHQRRPRRRCDAGPDGKPGALVGGASLWIVRRRRRTAASWDFVKYLTAARRSSEWSSATGYIPVRTLPSRVDPSRLYTTDPRFKVPYDQLLASPDTPVRSARSSARCARYAASRRKRCAIFGGGRRGHDLATAAGRLTLIADSATVGGEQRQFGG